jgi:hypothetical protein
VSEWLARRDVSTAGWLLRARGLCLQSCVAFVPERWTFRLFCSVYLVAAYSFTMLPFHSRSVHHFSHPLSLHNLDFVIESYRSERLHMLTEGQMFVCVLQLFFMSTACDTKISLSRNLFLLIYIYLSTP